MWLYRFTVWIKCPCKVFLDNISRWWNTKYLVNQSWPCYLCIIQSGKAKRDSIANRQKTYTKPVCPMSCSHTKTDNWLFSYFRWEHLSQCLWSIHFNKIEIYFYLTQHLATKHCVVTTEMYSRRQSGNSFLYCLDKPSDSQSAFLFL